MVSKKYLKDYNVERTPDEKGRMRNRAVYVGGYYTFSPPVSKADKLIIALLTVISGFAFIGVFILRTQAAHIWYVMLPFVLTMLPLYFLFIAAFSLLFSKEVMIRYDSDRISSRMCPSALISTVLAAVSLIGFIIALFTTQEKFAADDLLFCILALVVAAASAVVYWKFRLVKAVKTDKTIEMDDERVY